MNYYLGFDIGGTKCASILAKDCGNSLEFLERTEFATNKLPPDNIIELLIKNSIASMKKYNVIDLKAVGISCGGPLNSRDGIILCPPNLIGWNNIEIVKILEEKMNLPVFLQNDAKACAVAENRWGAGIGTKNMIFCTMGTGFGAGILINGKVYTGASDMAGEVGHIRLADDGPIGFGKAGSFEGFCSGGGITRLAKKIIADKLSSGIKIDSCFNLKHIDTKLICNEAQKGNPTALEIIEVSAKKLGLGLSILIDILNPEAIVIGSVYARNENLFKPIVDRVIKEEAISYSEAVCKILPAKLGDSIGDYAAIVVAIDGMETRSAN